ncbi:MAG: hypothetical protein H0W62_08025, partial [Chitinophagales bacterium]|nr:hypothetical protein [Chitinophagales bacterium]
MKYVIYCLIALAFHNSVYAQTWLPLGEGVQPEHSYQSADVKSMVFDSVNKWLYVGGDFYYAGDKVSRMMGIWNGTSWISTEKPNAYLGSPVA